MEDILIWGGLVIDGTGALGYHGDVSVKDGVITAIGDLKDVQAHKMIDAHGLAVAPGFIDAHAHSDTAFMKDDSGASKIFQGITTEVTGQCGDSPFPGDFDSFEAFVNDFKRNHRGMGVNQAMLVGHGSLRAAVMGCGDRAATPDELEKMKAQLHRDLQAGAWGLSLGLEYAPGFFAGEDELQALATVVRRFDGLVTCHMRNEGLKIFEAMDELLNVGRASGAHVHISHLKLDRYQVHGQAPQVFQYIEKARQQGVNVTADMYPYNASSTALTIRCPKWSKEGGSRAVLDFLKGPRRQEVIEGIRQHYFNAQRAETCLFGDDGGYWPEIVGKTLRQVAEELLNTRDYAEAAAQVLERTRAEASCVFFVMDEKDVRYFLAQDIGIGSDGYALPGDAEKVGYKPHPRSFGAIAEFFRQAREHHLCSLEEAVRRVTGKAADMLGLVNRGRLKPGMAADLTVFDPASIGPRATYLEPVQLAQGVKYVILAGRLALEDGIQTDVRAGQFLLKGKAPSL